MKKVKVKVVYDGKDGINSKLDEKINTAMIAGGFEWYAQGCDTVEPFKRDIAFDIEVPE